jgi:hypothetical protein
MMSRRDKNAAGRSLLFFRSCSPFLAILIALFALPGKSFAQPLEDWNNPVSGNWFTATNWSTDSVPTAAVNAVVDDGGTAQVIGGNAKVGNLTIGATAAGSTVEVTSGTTLTISALTIGPDGTLIADPGSLFTQSGGFVNNGNLIVTCGTFNNAPITGSGTVTKNDSGGTVVWQAPLSATSSVVVNAGSNIRRRKRSTNGKRDFDIDGK